MHDGMQRKSMCVPWLKRGAEVEQLAPFVLEVVVLEQVLLQVLHRACPRWKCSTWRLHLAKSQLNLPVGWLHKNLSGISEKTGTRFEEYAERCGTSLVCFVYDGGAQ